MSEQIKMTLRDYRTNDKFAVYIDVHKNSLSEKWLSALNQLLKDNYHLEKNYCFFGFADYERNGKYILNQVNQSIAAINQADIGYVIDDHFSMDNCIEVKEIDERPAVRLIIHEKFNWLHRYFEDLQGVSGQLSPFYNQADANTRWHIRQLNLLCHEFESWALSYNKKYRAPFWQRHSQLMCWLNAPRFVLDPEDYSLFGIETLNRPMGGVYVGVNKAVGKHHWEGFCDEGRDSRVGELVTTTLRPQTEAAGDFDIEWSNNPETYDWQVKSLLDFRTWLINNGFDPDDKMLTIGHPQVGQINLEKTFGTDDYQTIWNTLYKYLDVYSIETSTESAVYDYHWSDSDFVDRQVAIISQGTNK